MAIDPFTRHNAYDVSHLKPSAPNPRERAYELKRAEWRARLGKRLLVTISDSKHLTEVRLVEVSPLGLALRLQLQQHTHYWHHIDDVKCIEELPSSELSREDIAAIAGVAG
jgi:hypothetical protein